jgi:hypothetical protein
LGDSSIPSETPVCRFLVARPLISRHYMTRSRAKKPVLAASSWPLLLGAAVAASLASCDNPACVFGPNGCQTLPNGGANQVSAAFADTGELVVPAPPSIRRIYPSGFAKPESPIVIVFSEAMVPGSVEGAFTVQTSFGGGGGGLSSVLVGDGRVLVLIPTILVGGQEYRVILNENAVVRDLSGAILPRPADGVVGTFSVDNEPGSEPQLLMSWPIDQDFTGSEPASPITEIVTVFDRILNATTVTPATWSVQVDGVDPTFDPVPEPVSIRLSNGTTTADPRIWTWTSIDTSTGERASLGIDQPVTIDLSTSTNITQRITTVDGDVMAPLTVDFRTLTFDLPMELAIESLPSDAIGIQNLSPTGTRPLMVSANIVGDALAGDVLEIFLVGTNPPDPSFPDAPALISRFREIPLTPGPGPFLLEESDLGLVTSNSPLRAVFADGDFSMGFALRRGDQRTPLRLIDVDSSEEGVQDPLIDLAGPEFLNLIGQAKGDFNMVSDLRELSVSGLATEQVRTAEVVAHLASGDVDNLVMGELPPLPSFSSNGNFVAAPVFVGQLPFSETLVAVDMVAYDRALNPSTTVNLTYTQRGSAGTGAALMPGGNVDVTVFDAVTLAPIEGAQVYRHESDGSVITPTLPLVASTNAEGEVTIAAAPFENTVLTVEAVGYGLFTYQNVPTTRLDVPLAPTTITLGLAGQSVSTPGSSLTTPFLHAFMADSRVLLPGDSVRESLNSSYNPLLNSTATLFSQVFVSLGEVGLLTFLATKDPADLSDPNAFSPGTFLQAFELNYPRVPLGEPPAVDVAGIAVSELLSGASVEPADIPLGISPQSFSKPPNYALDFPNPTGNPSVSTEALTYGVEGMMTTGLGLAYFNGGADNWDIRAAYSATAQAGGELATDLVIEDERLLRVEVVDDSGNRSGIRQPLSTSTGTLAPPGVPLLLGPAANSGGSAYNLVFENVITGAYDTEGIYRAVLLDSEGRRWDLWTPDLAVGAGSMIIHVPPIAIVGGVPLTDGIITCVLEAWAWDGFDAGDLMYSDVDRRHEQFTAASPKVFSQP